ncbi:heparinase II/III family protein [Fibrella sp. HMF5335]|uniref:Heparinase II/III family protein n=1 Tax=Fibrella rubiginis TaxID=2817060 RepID=A0A939GDF3_9BACT|nr:heparinase II/III family protein [Fibrella rubiginis]MBO0937062.1 heparinase II/III family protein [Fibrella rubiginis]
MKVNRFLLLLFCLMVQVAMAQTDYVGSVTKLADHPRILLLKGQEVAIKQTIDGDKTWSQLHQTILAECNTMMELPQLERIKIGRRLLDKSREALRRVFFLCYAWRMTHQGAYLKRAEKELLAIAAFSDWNPTHFLDVAEMTMAAAIGYDWLYDDLSPESRSAIREAIVTKGIQPSLDSQYNGWLKASHNWNQVCNASMAYGAMAIFEDHPALARQIINRSVNTITLPMNDYGPDGSYPEGYGYWGYGTSFNVLLVSALDKLFKTDFGLSQQPGFLKTAGFMENMTGPTGASFNFSDAGVKGELQPAMFWFANKLNDPSLLWQERPYLTDPTLARQQVRNRLLPATLLWSNGLKISRLTPPKNTLWVGEGKTPVAFLRSSWTDPAAIYVAIKGGTPSTNHAHMDVGSFVMDADGVRWAMDFGMQQYESLESKGVDLWNMKQHSQRWQVFRYGNSVHNTLTVNDSLQRVSGKALITSSSATPLFMNATTDLTTLYSDGLAKANRGIAIVDKAYVVVRDELQTPSTEATVRWTMLTPATVKLVGTTKAELTQGGKTLLLQVQEPAAITLKTWSTTPPHDYDAPNPGTVRVGFEVTMPANTKTAFTVLLIPQKAGGQVIQTVPPLPLWPR